MGKRRTKAEAHGRGCLVLLEDARDAGDGIEKGMAPPAWSAYWACWLATRSSTSNSGRRWPRGRRGRASPRAMMRPSLRGSAPCSTTSCRRSRHAPACRGYRRGRRGRRKGRAVMLLRVGAGTGRGRSGVVIMRRGSKRCKSETGEARARKVGLPRGPQPTGRSTVGGCGR